MYSKIQEDISHDYYQKQFANDGPRFVAWYLRCIHNLDPVEAKDCITDGKGDKQIDAIYIDNDASIIYIIQGKFYSGKVVDAEPLREVLASWVQIKDLKKLQEDANEKLKTKINELSVALEDDYEICFELIVTSELSDAAKDDLTTFRRVLSEDDTLSANLSVIDNETLRAKYEEALNRNRPYINYAFKVEPEKCMEIQVGGIKAVIASISLKECVNIPGIKDGSLFRKNVRQSLGSSNKVNKGIASTLKNDIKDFFFFHNGITAICSSLKLENGLLSVKELNVVNGCQSLSTIYTCSETVKDSQDGYILFRFYEITDSEKADKISTSTNSQSAVKPRDLRSNDKYVLQMKKEYEQFYTDGYFVTKRGEFADSAKYNSSHIVALTDLGKQLIAWHSQRPTISYSETKIFDKYFDQIFRREYMPEKIQALNDFSKCISARWIPENPLGLNVSLLAMKAYAPYHHLYTISVFFCEANKLPLSDTVPDPAKAYKLLLDSNLLDTIVDMSGQCLNMAFESASSECVESGKIFSPQNWIKAKASLKDIRVAVKNRMDALKTIPETKELVNKICQGLKMNPEDFESRWSAD